MPQIFSGKKQETQTICRKRKVELYVSSAHQRVLAEKVYWQIGTFFLKPYIDGKRCHMSKKKLEICSFLQFTRKSNSLKGFQSGIFHLEPHKKNPPLKFKEQSKRIGPTLVVFMSLELKASQNFFPVHISVSRFRDKLGIFLASNYVSNVNAFIKVNFS